LDLTDELEVRRVRESEQMKQHEFEKHRIINDIEGLRVTIAIHRFTNISNTIAEQNIESALLHGGL